MLSSLLLSALALAFTSTSADCHGYYHGISPDEVLEQCCLEIGTALAFVQANAPSKTDSILCCLDDVCLY